MCVLLSGEVQCTNYDDSDKKIYEQLANCEKDAAYRFYGMAEFFDVYNIPYERMEVGCEQVDPKS